MRALLALVMVGLLAGCGQNGTNEAGYISGDGRTQEIPVADRGKPVELTGKTLDGKPFDLADSRGKVTVLNVWWTGCAPCRKEMPMLQAAYEELGDEVSFVGINTRDASAAQGQAFERHYGVDYPSVYSPDGEAVLALKGSLAPRAIPATAILDTEGRVDRFTKKFGAQTVEQRKTAAKAAKAAAAKKAPKASKAATA